MPDPINPYQTRKELAAEIDSLLDSVGGGAGAQGDSAYQVWLDQGNSGTEQDFLDSLVGAAGTNGQDGTDGNDGTNGSDGSDGLSAYQIWINAGNSGTEADFLASLVGADGADGTTVWPHADSSVDDGDNTFTGTTFATLETLLYDSGASDYGFRNKTYNAPSIAEWSITGGDGSGGQDWYTGFYSTSGNWRFYDSNNGFGLMYDDDYSSTWTSRSLVDKAYVDANSFYQSSGSIPASRTYSAENSRAFTYYAYDSSSSNWSTRGLVQIGQFNVQLARAVGSNGSFSGHYSINLSSSGFKVWDSVDNKGMEYGADYSANFTDRSIVDKAYVDSVAGGGSTPTSTTVFQAALSSTTQNTNATSHDYTWNSSTKDTAHVTHTDGGSEITLAAGDYRIFPEIVVTNGAANNRQTWALYLDHLNSSDTSYYEFLVGASVYIRDDASTYDEGAAAGCIPLIVSANDKIIIRSKRLDAQSSGGNNYADQTQSRLRIDRIS